MMFGRQHPYRARFVFLMLFVGLSALAPQLPFLSEKLRPWLSTLTTANFLAIYAMSWDLLSGYTGQISFGHAFFVGAAGYTSAMLNLHLDLPVFATIPLGILVAVVLGTLFAFPALRLKGPYFTLVTLIVLLVAIKVVGLFSRYTGGGTGRGGLDPLPGLTLITPLDVAQKINFYYSLGLMAVVALGLLLVASSKAGRIFEAIREDEAAVEAAGVNPAKFKIFALMLGALAAGAGGAFWVHYWKSIGLSSTLSLSLSFEMIIACVVGGMGTLLGPILGAYLLETAKRALAELSEKITALNFLQAWTEFMLLALLIVFLLFARRGILQGMNTIFRKLVQGHSS